MGFDVLSYAIGLQAGKGNGGGTGGGSVEGVHFVTFMSEDGSTELYKRPVADGDDCADPVIRGLIAEPEKTSTAQYAYTLAGWSASPNGALDENILKAVTADKTVYANFAAVLRYYTIKFYDGETLLKSESLAYGSTPTITEPQKSGFSFDGWEPAITAVTGEATYTAKWVEAITFAGGSWEDIVRIAEAGEAQKYFALGDRKTLEYKRSATLDIRTVTVQIVGFDHDDLADGTGKAAMSLLIVDDALYSSLPAYNSNYDGWPTCEARTNLGKYLNYFPEGLKNGVKLVNKQSYCYDGTIKTSNDYLWIPSATELCATNRVAGTAQTNDGVKYSVKATDFSGGLVTDSLTKILSRSGGSSNQGAMMCTQMSKTSENMQYSSTTIKNKHYNTTFGFCI